MNLQDFTQKYYYSFNHISINKVILFKICFFKFDFRILNLIITFIQDVANLLTYVTMSFTFSLNNRFLIYPFWFIDII